MSFEMFALAITFSKKKFTNFLKFEKIKSNTRDKTKKLSLKAGFIKELKS